MGKYTNQASSYKMGMKSLQASLENIVSELEETGGLISNEDGKDVLNNYVNDFNANVKSTLESLVLKCTSLPVLVMNKAKEIDRRIELEQEALKQQEEESDSEIKPSVIKKPNFNQKERDGIFNRDINSKMEW